MVGIGGQDRRRCRVGSRRSGPRPGRRRPGGGRRARESGVTRRWRGWDGLVGGRPRRLQRRRRVRAMGSGCRRGGLRRELLRRALRRGAGDALSRRHPVQHPRDRVRRARRSHPTRRDGHVASPARPSRGRVLLRRVLDVLRSAGRDTRRRCARSLAQRGLSCAPRSGSGVRSRSTVSRPLAAFSRPS